MVFDNLRETMMTTKFLAGVKVTKKVVWVVKFPQEDKYLWEPQQAGDTRKPGYTDAIKQATWYGDAHSAKVAALEYGGFVAELTLTVSCNE